MLIRREAESDGSDDREKGVGARVGERIKMSSRKIIIIIDSCATTIGVCVCAGACVRACLRNMHIGRGREDKASFLPACQSEAPLALLLTRESHTALDLAC
jgi:hypothetical protein